MASGTIFTKMLGVGMTKTAKIIVTARLAWFVGGLRSCPPLVCDRMDPVLVPRVGDRFTPCQSQHTGFAMTKKQKYVTGRLAWFVGGLRSCPLLVCDRMDPVLVPRVGDRFTPCQSQHTGFAMTKKQKYVIGKLAMPVQGLRSHLLQEIYRMDFATAPRAGDCFTASLTNQPWVRAVGVPLGQ